MFYLKSKSNKKKKNKKKKLIYCIQFLIIYNSDGHADKFYRKSFTYSE